MNIVKLKQLSVISQAPKFKEKLSNVKLPSQDPLEVKTEEVEVVEEMAAIVEVNVAMLEIAEEGVSSVEGKATSPENVLIQDKTITVMTIVVENSMKIETENHKIKGQNHQKEDFKGIEVDRTLARLKTKKEVLEQIWEEEEVQAVMVAFRRTRSSVAEAEAMSWEKEREEFRVAQVLVDLLNERIIKLSEVNESIIIEMLAILSKYWIFTNHSFDSSSSYNSWGLLSSLSMRSRMCL